jgi:hypothetical protein
MLLCGGYSRIALPRSFRSLCLRHIGAPLFLGEVDCKFEEEIWEFSGANDVQVTDLTLSPEQWIKGGTYTSGRTGPTLNSIMHVTVVPGP